MNIIESTLGSHYTHFKNLFGIFLNHFISYLAPVIIVILVGRYYSPSDFGVYSVAVSFMSVFAIFLSLGLGRVVTFEVAHLNSFDRKQIPPFIGNAVASFLIISVFGSLAIAVFLIFLKYDWYLIKVILALALGYWFLNFGNLFVSVFIGLKKMLLPVVFSASILIGAIIFVLPAVFLQKDILLIALLWSIARGLGLLAISLIIFNRSLISWKIQFGKIRYILKRSIGIGLDNVIYRLGANLTNILLPLFLTAHAIGIFNGAFRPFILLTMPHQVLFLFFSPYLAEKRDDIKSGENRLHLFHEITAFVNIFMMLIPYFFSETVCKVIFGRNLLSSAPYMKLLAIGYLIYYFPPFTAPLKAFGMEWKVLKSSIAQIAINLSGLIILTPYLGVQGAVISVISAYITYWCVTVYIYWKDRIRPVKHWTRLGVYLVGSFVAGNVIKTWNNEWNILIFFSFMFLFTFLIFPWKEMLLPSKEGVREKQIIP